MTYVDFFSNLGFDFNINLKPKAIDIESETTLSLKLKNSVFFYKNPNNTNTNFYLITCSLEDSELEQFRKYVWNKNDANIIFYYSTETDEVKMLYAKYSPKVSNKDSVLEAFSATSKDLDAIEKIKHWQFDSGAFWLNYKKFLSKSKYKGIDKELVATLSELKEQLSNLLFQLISEDSKRNEVVQALIDRTLYIKYLEDNHIINSYFYDHHFQDKTLNYKTLLDNKSKKEINELYNHIHEIFNNSLFDTPKINEEYLTTDVCDLISNSFKSNLKSGQLRLFDFRFDVLPIEFISYIYEVFLSEKQKTNGIFYTPKKLAQLIVDDVIKEDKIGSILDPSSGSGMFLITGYQKLLEIARKQNLEPEDNIEKIRFRSQLLYENIFGIEKQLVAQRFTIFSLSLQIFNGINPVEIKEYIAKQLKDNEKVNLFSEFPFFQNIKRANTLDTSNEPFEKKVFSYIVGNPPFFEIPNTEEFQTEISFLNSYQIDISEEAKKVAKNIVGRSQISQCFFLKIKEWSDENTRFGFVSNSSNFYNDHSEDFQNFFYSNYGIEKVYELSRVKKILFEKANESVVSIIFTNNIQDNIIDYYPVDLGLFSEKPFELLIIQEDKVVEIAQNELICRKIRLRDFLVGNEYDNIFISNFNSLSKLEDYLLINNESLQGLTRKSNKEIASFLNLSISDFKNLDKKGKKEIQREFELKNYLSKTHNDNFPTPYVYEYINLNYFKIDNYDGYVNLNSINKNNFQRPRQIKIFEGSKILITRVGNRMKAVYTPFDIVFSVNIFGIRVKEERLSYFITSLLNSYLINYIINIKDKKRIGDNLPRIDGNILKNIPIPKELNQDLVSKISAISKGLAEGQYEYSEKELQLNELIFDLYELSYWEKQRIKDYFLPIGRIGKKKKALDSYTDTIKEVMGFYFESPISVHKDSVGFDLIVVKISFGTNANNPQADKTKKYLLNEIFEQNPNANFLASQEKIFGKDCVYIIKEDINKNWTETKAFEDGQDILRHLIPNEDGERIH
ncbi:N-6 DNA methylase [Myroides odoratimimus]|uniref:N-6 DNA methylase n=1 Tax=Myroides odoratimimus TaxID=76832 RepID=UPI0025778809|nr:N-6 DNA methylase [Myroides odoratimimus]MDM1521336.1 N-6 DNA methylase [Myroides odoratimimus]